MKKIIGTIIFPFFCLFLSFFVLISDPAFTYLLLDNPESIQPTQQLLGYFAGIEEIPEVFDFEEKVHLADTKRAIHSSFIILIILAIALWYCKDSKKIARHGTVLLLLILFIATLIPFDKFFFYFHQLVFPHGGWMFASESTLITFYSQNFFMLYGISIAVHAIIISLTLFFFEIVSRKG